MKQDDEYVVPGGKRLVIEYVNCFVMSESLRIYARAGSVVKPGFVPAGSELRLSGYLLDVCNDCVFGTLLAVSRSGQL